MSSNQVVTIPTDRAQAYRPDQPDAVLIEQLEIALDLARGGLLHDYALVYLDRTQPSEPVHFTHYAARCYAAQAGISGLLSELQWKLAADMAGE